jgi:hypothetical protein
VTRNKGRAQCARTVDPCNTLVPGGGKPGRQELHAAQAELRARAAYLMEARERAARAEGELAGLRGRPWWRRLWPG